MKYALIVLALVVLLCSASFATSTSAPINLTVEKYGYVVFPGADVPQGTNVTKYFPGPQGGDPANTDTEFSITLSNGATSGSDVINMLWGFNYLAYFNINLDPGNLPGVWTINCDGAGVTPANQQFYADPWDYAGTPMLAPIKLMVDGVNPLQAAGAYSGTLILSMVPALP